MPRQQPIALRVREGSDHGTTPWATDAASDTAGASHQSDAALGASGLVAAVAVVALLAAAAILPGLPGTGLPPSAAVAVSGLGDDGMPLRWVDPRPRSGCGPERVSHGGQVVALARRGTASLAIADEAAVPDERAQLDAGD